MSTQTIDVVLGPNENAVINITRTAHKVRVPKPKFQTKDENGDFVMKHPNGVPMVRLGREHLAAVFKTGHASFTQDASMRLGGVLGTTARLIAGISNIKMSHKKGVNLYGWHGNMPRLEDFTITETDGRVVIDKKF